MPNHGVGHGAGVNHVPITFRAALLEAEQLRTEVTVACSDGVEIRGLVIDVGADTITIADGPHRHDVALFHVVRVAW